MRRCFRAHFASLAARILICGLIGMLIGVANGASAAEIKGLRVWAGPDHTRAVFDLDQRVDYRVFELGNPARLVVDLDRSRVVGDLTTHLTPSNGHRSVIQGVRHGVRDGHDARVVFELDDAVQVQSFLLEPAGDHGHRLVIDLTPSRAVPAAERVREVAQAARNGTRDMIVAIDAGHGGEDPGAIGPSGTFEKTVTLAIAKELARQIDEQPGMRAVMIRTGDYFVRLQDRHERARQAEADLFVSVHADAFHDFRVRGSSVYVLSRRGASSEAARFLARSENKSDLIGGVKLDRGDDLLSSVLLDLSQSVTMEYSNAAAEQILGQLGTVGQPRRRQVERANFMVLRSPDVPSVLIEVGFISNPQDEQQLNTAPHRRAIASAITDGVREHFLSTAPQGTWFAAQRSNGQRHVVQRGDTLGGIAQRYQVSVRDIRATNNLNGDLIRPGAVLVIPVGS